jgi:hypothetical protein
MSGLRRSETLVSGISYCEQTSDKHQHIEWEKPKKVQHGGEDFKNILKAEMEKQNVPKK